MLSTSGEALQTIEDAVSGGATGVVLFEGAEATGAAELYDAACRLRDTLRGRAVLLVLDRTDIADAAGADGVLLSSQGKGTVSCAQPSHSMCTLIHKACATRGCRPVLFPACMPMRPGGLLLQVFRSLWLGDPCQAPAA